MFEATVQPGWEQVTAHFHVFTKLKNRRAIDYDQYEAIHTGVQSATVYQEKGRWALERIGMEGVTLGARYYAAQ